MPTSPRRFEGKVALVTASTAGIGLGIAHRLGAEGAKLVVCSRKEANVESTLEELRRSGIDCVGTAANVGKAADLDKVVKLAVDSFGKIDVLVSNAAVNPAVGMILDQPEAVIDKIMAVNVKSAILLAQKARPHFAKGANIIFISSFAGYNPSPPLSLYSISKTALLALTKALANELGPEGIRVNCVAPGTVRTKFAAALVETEAAEEHVLSGIWLGRLGTPADMAAAVAYLSSDDAAYVTGETLVVSGGSHSRL